MTRMSNTKVELEPLIEWSMTKMHIGQRHECRWLGVNYHGIGGPGYSFLDVDFIQALEGIVGRLSGSYGKISVLCTKDVTHKIFTGSKMHRTEEPKMHGTKISFYHRCIFKYASVSSTYPSQSSGWHGGRHRGAHGGWYEGGLEHKHHKLFS